MEFNITIHIGCSIEAENEAELHKIVSKLVSQIPDAGYHITDDLGVDIPH